MRELQLGLGLDDEQQLVLALEGGVGPRRLRGAVADDRDEDGVPGELEVGQPAPDGEPVASMYTSQP